ncbi:acyltransferase family protein (plasmid) [Roseobacteraceae bacterium NS-SX3]
MTGTSHIERNAGPSGGGGRPDAAGRAVFRTAPRIAERCAGRDNHFNLIRMLAATGVLVAHAFPISLGYTTPQPFELALHGLSLGMICVWIFFAISGFFITRSFDRKSSIGAFLLARVLRLYPALIVVLLLTLAAGALLTRAPPGEYWAAADHYLISNLRLFGIRYWLPGVFDGNPYGSAINGSLWSLSYEVTCYAGVLLTGILGLLRRRRLFALFCALFLMAYGAMLIWEFNTRIERLVQLGLPFLLGMGFYVWRRHVPLSPWLAAGLGLMAAAAWFTPLFLPAFAVALSYGVFVLGYGQNRWLLGYNRLGDYSYGIYIYAFPFQQLAVLAGAASPMLNMAAALPPALICAVLSWHLVEHPALQLRHRALRAGRPRPEAAE